VATASDQQGEQGHVETHDGPVAGQGPVVPRPRGRQSARLGRPVRALRLHHETCDRPRRRSQQCGMASVDHRSVQSICHVTSGNDDD